MTGGFLFANSQEQNAQAAEITWTKVFSDDFNRANGPVGNGWSELSGGSAAGTWSITDQKAVGYYNGSVTSIKRLVRPSTEQFLNTRIELEIDGYPSGTDYFLLRQQQEDTGTYYRFQIDSGSQASPSTYRLLIYYCVSGTCTYVDSRSSLTLTDKVKLVAEAVSSSASQTAVTATLYDITGTETQIGTVTIQNTTPELQSSGSVGMYGYADKMEIDNFSIYTDDVDDQVLTSDVVQIGTPVAVRLQSADTSVFTWSDNGAGGAFSSPTSGSGDAITYTPASVGTVNLTAVSANDLTLDVELFVSPYSTAIGFLGDSITSQAGYTPSGTSMATALGTGFSTVFSAWGGASSGSYANDDASGTPVLTNAINAFTSGGVDIVHIMLGTNDLCGATPATTYKANLQTVIDALKTAGLRQVVLSRPTYITASAASNCVTNLNLTPQYDVARQELADENGGFVRIGDTQAYDWFETNQSALLTPDGVHPNSAGFEALEGFWAEAIWADLEYEIAPDSEWLASDSEFTLGETGSLTLSVDKYIDEFVGVKVDGVTLPVDKYAVTEGSTVIELLNTYLNTLGAGTYTLSVEFAGGVWVDSTFTISASGVITPTPISPNAPALPSVPNTGFNLGKFVSENRGAVLSALVAVIAGLGISVVLVGRKLAKEI